jgi:hypothetical protein
MLRVVDCLGLHLTSGALGRYIGGARFEPAQVLNRNVSVAVKQIKIKFLAISSHGLEFQVVWIIYYWG